MRGKRPLNTAHGTGRTAHGKVIGWEARKLEAKDGTKGFQAF